MFQEAVSYCIYIYNLLCLSSVKWYYILWPIDGKMHILQLSTKCPTKSGCHLVLLQVVHTVYICYTSLPAIVAEQPTSSDNKLIIIVVVAGIVILAVVLVATVLIIRARKSPTTSGNGNIDVGQHLYENQNFHEDRTTSRSNQNTEVNTEVSII